MFTRMVKMISKPGQAKDAARSINDKVLAILKKQRGFLDEIVLVSTSDPNQVLALSFWKSREDAERYDHEQFSKIRDMMQDVLSAPPVVETYDVEVSTSHHITAGKAA